MKKQKNKKRKSSALIKAEKTIIELKETNEELQGVLDYEIIKFERLKSANDKLVKSYWEIINFENLDHSYKLICLAHALMGFDYVRNQINNSKMGEMLATYYPKKVGWLRYYEQDLMDEDQE